MSLIIIAMFSLRISCSKADDAERKRSAPRRRNRDEESLTLRLSRVQISNAKKKNANSTVTNCVARLQPAWMRLREERVRNKDPPSIPQRTREVRWLETKL